jgi:hypothetical protein
VSIATITVIVMIAATLSNARAQDTAGMDVLRGRRDQPAELRRLLVRSPQQPAEVAGSTRPVYNPRAAMAF